MIRLICFAAASFSTFFDFSKRKDEKIGLLIKQAYSS